ncbi:ATP-binding protein [Novosphingobium sp. LASN5T]|uniref:ATP-binding protein n=1 Tax=Novosphingobium sp. LASN5T TaxID=2491021 RepID=UPI000F5E7BD2|nr:ATP-binding protein [Novosphingobium sp. LASN5T]RQW46139.1 ATP-binding protein [Novosphingobium sp. LASN5T]
MSLPASIHASVSSALLGRVTRIFNNSVGDVLVETLQNARRAGANRVDIDVLEEGGRSLLVIRDDGTGIADPAKVLTLGDSGWDADTARREDPAGMGVFSLAGRHVEIRSRTALAEMGWRVEIPADAWESGVPLAIETCDVEPGTEIRIDMPDAWSRDLAAAAANAARHYPLPVRFRGEALKQVDFLAGACRIENWQGCRIGVFHDRNHLPASYPRINFHGLTVLCPLPSVTEVDGGECWHVRVDIRDAPALQLVLPARKEMVQNSALEALREAAEAAIYRALARAPGHRLAHAQWLRAQKLGIELPEAEAWLHGWFSRTADDNGIHHGERVVDRPMILFPDSEPAFEQCAGRALRGEVLGGTLVREQSAFAGYRWYDSLPRICSLSFVIGAGDSEVRYEESEATPPDLVSGQVASIMLDVAVSSSQDGTAKSVTYSLPVDVLILPEDGWSTDLDETVILLSPKCAIDPCDLADLLIDICFCACDDVDADSWETQQRNFQMRAGQIANALLLGEDAAILARIRDVIQEEIRWLIPLGRQVSMLAGGNGVELTFVANAIAHDPGVPLPEYQSSGPV